MSETSPSTQQETTGATSEATTSSTEATSSTTTQETTQPASETPTAEKSALNTEPAKEEPKTEPKTDKPVVPEKYADFTLPEGMTADPAAMEKATGLFKELGLSQEQAQKLVTLEAERIAELATRNRQAFTDMRNGWLKSVRENPKFAAEFGADGKIKPDSKTLVGLGRVLDSLGNAKLANDFRHAMDLTGAGDHPAFFEVMSILAERLAEGAPVKGNAASPHGQSASGTAQRRSAAQEIYPNLS